MAAGPPRTKGTHIRATTTAPPGRPGYDGNVAELLQRITHDPAVMGGRPCIRGLRVTVGTVIGLLAAGRSAEEILAAYPYLEPDDIRAALTWAAWRVEEIEVPLRAS